MSWSQPGQRTTLEAWGMATFEPQCRTRRAVQAKGGSKAKHPPKTKATSAGAGAAGGAAGGAAAVAAEADPAVMVAAPPAEPQEVREMVQQQMGSLQAYGLPLYPSYTESEKEMHYPSRTWKLTLPGETEPRELAL